MSHVMWMILKWMMFNDTTSCEIPEMNGNLRCTYVRLIHLHVHKSAHTRILFILCLQGDDYVQVN